MGTGKTLRVRLTPAQQAALAEVSTTTERTESEIVRSALELLAEYRAAYARARRSGRVATAVGPRSDRGETERGAS